MSTNRSQQRTIAARYAGALFDVAREKSCHEQVAADLRALANAVDSSGALVKALNNPTLPVKTKQAVMKDILLSLKAHDVTYELVAFVIEKKRAAVLPDIASEFEALCLTHKNELVAHVTSAQPMSAADMSRIADRLTQAAGKKVNVTQSQNPALLGGFKITLGSRMLDASLLGRLQRLGATLAV